LYGDITDDLNNTKLIEWSISGEWETKSV
jgi:hypothetical protein